MPNDARMSSFAGAGANRLWGLKVFGSQVQGIGFMVKEFIIRVWGIGFMVQSMWFMI